MQTETVTFVSLWDLFDGLELLNEIFTGDNCTFTWVNACYTLESPQEIVTYLEGYVESEEEKAELTTLKERVAALPPNTYANLES